MSGMIDFFVRSKRLILTLLSIILIAGMLSYANIVKEEDPHIPFPVFLINISHDGISPEDAERLLIKPMEVQLRGLEGLKRLDAVGREGGAYLIAEFHPDQSQDRARQLVRDAMDMARSRLPDDTLEPTLSEFSTSDEPVLTIVLSGPVPERTMAQIVRSVREELEAQSLIREVETGGEREQMLEVLIDPAKLTVYNVTPAELYGVVANNNRLVAAGSLDTASGRFSVRVDGLVEEPDDVLSLPIKASTDGVVTLRDLTTVRRTFKDANRLSHYNGQPAYTIDVMKRTEANVVEAAEQAKVVVEKMRVGWPDGIQIDYLFDQSVEVADFLDTLRNNVVSAIVLVVIIVVAALGTRAAMLVGVAVPASFLFGIMCLHYTGESINNVVMFGLILAVGMLVDGAIVVTEYADRKMVEGMDRQEAYSLAAKRMGLPIISSTLTTVAAFLPIIFWPGIMGEFMKYIPITVIYTLMGSLLVALVFLPTLGATIGKPSEVSAASMQALAQDATFSVDRLRGFTRWYGEILEAVVRKPFRVLAGTVVIMVMIVMAYGAANLGSRTFSEGDPPLVRLLVHARGNMSIGEIDRIVRSVGERVYDTPGVKAVWSTTMLTNNDITGSEDVVGRVNLMLEDWNKRQSYEDLKNELRERTTDMPGIKVELSEVSFGPIQGKDIQIRLSSEDPALLATAVATVKGKLGDIDGVVEVEDTLHVPGIDWSLDVDRAEAGRYGTDVTTVGSFIQLMTNGMLAGRYRPADSIDEEDIRIRLPQDARGIQAFDELTIMTPKGPVALTNLVDRVPTPKIGKITRTNAERSVTVSANVRDDVQVNRVVEAMKEWQGAAKLDPRVNVKFEGSDEFQQEASSFLFGAMLLALALMGLILLAQFNSFYQTALILTAVIMGAIGVLFGLFVTGREFSVIMTGIGIVALAGIVVNNNIVLIDTYNRFRDHGIDPLEAIVHTGAQRLRPILLTTGTTMIGLLPMALEFNVNFFDANIEFGSPTSKFWVDLAIAVVWGLGASTILTLVFTPAALAAREQLRIKWRARRDRKAAGAIAAEVAENKLAAE
ncbi:efflux RND transporter permease subunit [Pseudokordiimonas caeni]|uniref:efflux RND transporter permease subunit n=1 Tax=Pseudokordiimonas caeni TaxID=2997908 RepID=UPI0028124957|nr:efflux RND transporter permease subunit [Pseudokordiimonas caeni]